MRGRIAALATLALVAPAAASAATWEAPLTLPGSGGAPSDLTLTALSDGGTLATWWARHGRTGWVDAAFRAPGVNAFGAPARLGPSSTTAPAALPGGRVLAMGGGDPGLGARVQAWTGRPSRLPLRRALLGLDGWDLPVVATDASGRAVAAWTWEQPRRGAGGVLRPRVVVVATRSAGGRWTAPRRISPLPGGPPYGQGRGPALSATSVSVAVGGRGTAVVAWQREGVVETRVSTDAGRSFGRVARLGRTTFAHPRPATAVSPAGLVAVGWSSAPSAGPGHARLRTLLVLRRPGRAFGRTMVVQDGTAPTAALEPVTGQFGARVLVRFAADGSGVAAWQTAHGDQVGVRLAGFSATGVRPAALHLPAPGELAAVLGDLVAAPGGVAAAAWTSVGSRGAPGAAWAAVGAPGSAPELLAETGASTVRLAAPAGRLTAAWISSSGGQHVVASTRHP